MKTSLTIALAVGASAALVHARKAGGTPDAHVALARAALGTASLSWAMRRYLQVAEESATSRVLRLNQEENRSWFESETD